MKLIPPGKKSTRKIAHRLKWAFFPERIHLMSVFLDELFPYTYISVLYKYTLHIKYHEFTLKEGFLYEINCLNRYIIRQHTSYIGLSLY